ncbi:MAG: isochorismatase family cysteine hydrolase [Verrucomicrobiales bacterium]
MTRSNSSAPQQHNDPLRETYRESIIEAPQHVELLKSRDTALLCIDLQYLDAADGFGVFADPESSGVPKTGRRYYFTSLREWVLPNVRALQDTFRSHGLEVIHVRIQALTRDGRDRSGGHKRLKLLAAPGSKEAEFLDEIAPQGDEIVINKTASGVFSSTNLNYVLQNLGIRALYVVGVYTNECVETTVRDACDLGYFVTLVEDACTTQTADLHDASIKTLRDRYARILSTDEVVADIDKLVKPPQPNAGSSNSGNGSVVEEVSAAM